MCFSQSLCSYNTHFDNICSSIQTETYDLLTVYKLKHAFLFCEIFTIANSINHNFNCNRTQINMVCINNINVINLLIIVFIIINGKSDANSKFESSILCKFA